MWEEGLLVKLGDYNNYYDEQGRLVQMVWHYIDSINFEHVVNGESNINLSYNDKGEIESIVYKDSDDWHGVQGDIYEINYEWKNGNIIRFHDKRWHWTENISNIDNIYFDYIGESLEYDSHPNPFLQLPVAVIVRLQRLQEPMGDLVDCTLLCKNNCVNGGKYTYKKNGYPLHFGGKYTVDRDYEYNGMID